MPDYVNIDVSLGSKPIGTLRVPIPSVGSESPECKCLGPLPKKLQGKTLNEWVRAAILSTLAFCGYNGVKAAKVLKIPERTFYRKTKLLNIDLNALKAEYLLNKKLSRVRRKIAKRETEVQSEKHFAPLNLH